MTEYIINTTIENIRGNHPYMSTTLYIKIDKMGNVNIKRQTTTYQTGCFNQLSPIYDFYIINDNIPIPFYIIGMLKELFCQTTKHGNSEFSYSEEHNLAHYYNAIKCLKILKEDIARLYKPIMDELI
jgi:hypothetical protein